MSGNRAGSSREAGGLSPAMGRTAVFLVGGVGLLLAGIWLQVQPKLRYREVAAEAAGP